MEPRFNMFGNEIGARFSKRFAHASLVIAQSPLPKPTQELVALRASQINGCGFCVDMHSTEALAEGESSRRLFAVAAWRDAAALFTEKELAAFDLTDAVTRLGDHGVPDEVWDRAAAQFDKAELANLLIAISTINVWNRVAVATHADLPNT